MGPSRARFTLVMPIPLKHEIATISSQDLKVYKVVYFFDSANDPQFIDLY